MSSNSANLVLRNDTILGVCEAIGQDFGFHPNWIRLTLASFFYWFPFHVIGAYLLLGVIVLASRWIAPVQAEATAPRLAAETPAAAEQDAEEKDLAMAA